MVRGQESHELRGLNYLNSSITVDIEVAPGLVEVGIHVLRETLTLKSLVGSENLLGGSECILLAQPEGASWLTTNLASIIELLNWSSLLEGVCLNHGSHEDVVGVRGEVWSDDSLVFAINGTVFNGLPGVEDWVLFDDLLCGDSNILSLIIGLRVRGLGFGFNLNGALVWWSLIGSRSGVVSVVFLDGGVISVAEHGGELPDWLVSALNLDGALVWWSGVGLRGGEISISLLDCGILSVVEDGLERPDWLFSGGETEEACNGK